MAVMTDSDVGKNNRIIGNELLTWLLNSNSKDKARSIAMMVNKINVTERE